MKRIILGLISALLASTPISAQDEAVAIAGDVPAIIEQFSIDRSDRMTVRSAPVSTMKGTAALPFT